MRRLASLATAQTAAAGSQFVQKSKSGAVGAFYFRGFLFLLSPPLDRTIQWLIPFSSSSSLFPTPLSLSLPVTVFFSLVAAWLLTHEIKGFMRPELQHVVREVKERERKKEKEMTNLDVFLFLFFSNGGNSLSTSTSTLPSLSRHRASPRPCSEPLASETEAKMDEESFSLNAHLSSSSPPNKKKYRKRKKK